jgi:hypothetical protein
MSEKSVSVAFDVVEVLQTVFFYIRKRLTYSQLGFVKRKAVCLPPDSTQ